MAKKRKTGPKIPYKKEQVEQLIEDFNGNLAAAARSVGTPYKTFHGWVNIYGLKPYPDMVKQRTVLFMLERAKQLAMDKDRPSERMICKILDNWGYTIEFTEPAQRVEHTEAHDPGKEPYVKPRDLMEQRNESLK